MPQSVKKCENIMCPKHRVDSQLGSVCKPGIPAHCLVHRGGVRRVAKGGGQTAGCTQMSILMTRTVYLENCQMGRKAGSFYRIKNKEEGREGEPTSHQLGPRSHCCRGREDPEWVGRLESLHFCSGRALTGTLRLPRSLLADVAPGQEPLRLGPRSVFQHTVQIGVIDMVTVVGAQGCAKNAV